MQDLTGKRMAILATQGFEYDEPAVPRCKLAEVGGEVIAVSPETEEIRGWSKDVENAGARWVDEQVICRDRAVA